MTLEREKRHFLWWIIEGDNFIFCFFFAGSFGHFATFFFAHKTSLSKLYFSNERFVNYNAIFAGFIVVGCVLGNWNNQLWLRYGKEALLKYWILQNEKFVIVCVFVWFWQRKNFLWQFSWIESLRTTKFAQKSFHYFDMAQN